MRPERKAINGGVLAFIDVMACGLGAVILLLVIVDFNIDEIIQLEMRSEPEKTSAIGNGNIESHLLARVKILEDANEDLSNSIASLTTELLEAEIKKQATQEVINQRPAAIEVDESRNESGELIGLKVDGQSIIILLDSSSSMYSNLLSDNVYYSISPSESVANNSLKWRQALKIAKWLIDVAPDKSKIKFGVFSETTSPVTQSWETPDTLRKSFVADTANFFPKGGTNLQDAFSWLSKEAVVGSQVFLITDGLPTRLPGRNAVSNFFSACLRDPKGFVGGECRLQILEKSEQALNSMSIELNIILLPLEGDPIAAPAYWALAKANQGILFVPEANWP